MTEARSKRRVLPLIFIVKSFTKSLLIRFITITAKILTISPTRNPDKVQYFSCFDALLHQEGGGLPLNPSLSKNDIPRLSLSIVPSE